MYGYIYKTTNLINNKFYIGQHKSSVFDPNYYGSGLLINQAIKKYGKTNFKIEILEWCESLDVMCEKEKYYIKLYDALNKDIAYNISKGGEFGDSFTGQSPEKKEQMRIKMRESHLQYLSTPEGREQLKKTSERLKGKLAVNRKKVYQYDIDGNFIAEYESVSAAAKATGSNMQLVSKVCLGERNKTNNFRFSYTYETKLPPIDDNKNKKLSNSIKELWKNEEYKEKMSKERRNRIWINNGIENKIIHKDDIIPEGWKRGKIFL